MDNPVEFGKLNHNTAKNVNYLLLKYNHLIQFNEKEDVLEIGGGDGKIAKEVLFPFIGDRLKSLLGSDICQSVVDVANKFHRNEKISFVRIDITNVNDVEKYHDKFGHIFAFFVFHFVGNPERWSKNIFNMLKKNGQLFAAVMLKPHPYTLTIAAQKEDKNAPWAKYLQENPDEFIDYTEDPKKKFEEILTNAGLKVEMLEIEYNDNMNSYFPTLEVLNGVILSVNTYLKYIPEELKSSYKEDFVKKLRQFVHKGENGYFFTKKVLIVLAKKP